MSGGGESMGSIGLGKSGFGVGGCSMAMLQVVQHSCLDRLSHQSSVSVVSHRLRLKLPTVLNVQADRAHQLERIAVFDDARTHAVVEDHLSVFQPILEVHVDG
jgi:hypothetical protein